MKPSLKMVLKFAFKSAHLKSLAKNWDAGSLGFQRNFITQIQSSSAQLQSGESVKIAVKIQIFDAHFSTDHTEYLLTHCTVNAEKYSDRSSDVRTEQSVNKSYII